MEMNMTTHQDWVDQAMLRLAQTGERDVAPANIPRARQLLERLDPDMPKPSVFPDEEQSVSIEWDDWTKPSPYQRAIDVFPDHFDLYGINTHQETDSLDVAVKFANSPLD